MTEDAMVGWHHQHDGHEPEQTPGVGEGQGGLACCGPWELDTTEQVNNIRGLRTSSGLPCPSPGDLPDPGTEPGSPMLRADSLPSKPRGKPVHRDF